MSEYQHPEQKKELTRKEFLLAVKEFHRISQQLSDQESIIFHSSTALSLLKDVIAVRKKRFDLLDANERITNDIDLWMSHDAIVSLTKYLDDRSIPNTIENEQAPLWEGQRSINLTFKLRGVHFDIWSRESRDQNIGPFETTTIEVPLAELLPNQDAENISLRVLTKESLIEHYRKMMQHEQKQGNAKSSQRLEAMKKASDL